MKKILAITAAASLLVSANLLFTTPQEAVSQQEGPTAAVELLELIDGIAVPYDVLLDAQMEHPGFAVTGASTGIREGRDVYRLHIENSDHTSSRRNVYLLYDMQWRLMGEETLVAPAPVVREKPEPEPAEPEPAEQAPVSQETPDIEEVDEDEVEDEDDEEDIPEEEPEEPPVTENTRPTRPRDPQD